MEFLDCNKTDLREALAERAQRGQGHDGVAQPVGGADQDLLVIHCVNRNIRRRTGCDFR